MLGTRHSLATRFAARAWIAAIVVGCTHAAPAHPLANSSTTPSAPADDLCAVLDRVIEAGRDNFTSIDPAHDRTSGPFSTSVKPRDAQQAVLRPCCTHGAWRWTAAWPDSDGLVALQRRVLSCPLASRLRSIGVDGTAWRIADVPLIIELSAVLDGVELAVGRP